jgi:cell wall assembly regulator SMI1
MKTNLCAAIVSRKTKDIQALVAAGADVNALKYGKLPLVVAASLGKAEVAAILLENGANPNGFGADGETALIAAARQGKASTVQLLLAHGADVNPTSALPKTPLTEVVQGETHEHCAAAQLLIDAGACVNVDYYGGRQTTLMLASVMSTAEMIEILLRAGAEINAVRPLGTALVAAVLGNRPQNVNVLLQHGADPALRVPDGVDPELDGKSALELAESMKAKAIIKLLTGERAVQPLPTVVELWGRLRNILERLPPEKRPELRPGAADEELQRLEMELGQTFPEEFRESYLLHDGQLTGMDLAPAIGAHEDGYELMTAHAIRRDWRSWKELAVVGDFADLAAGSSPEVKGQWWIPAWVPFATNGAGDHLCIDLEPTPKGSRGQVIRVGHESPLREVIAGSFRAWLFAILEQWEAADCASNEVE